MSVNQIQIHVENIKCGGCEKSILKGLASLEGLSDVVIDRDQQLVSATGDPSLREALVAKLKSMGYPEQGSVSGLEAGLTNAKSLVSCAIGRISLFTLSACVTACVKQWFTRPDKNSRAPRRGCVCQCQ